MSSSDTSVLVCVGETFDTRAALPLSTIRYHCMVKLSTAVRIGFTRACFCNLGVRFTEHDSERLRRSDEHLNCALRI